MHLFVGRGGFEPPKPKHLIYSQAHLTTLVPSHSPLLCYFIISLGKEITFWIYGKGVTLVLGVAIL